MNNFFENIIFDYKLNSKISFVTILMYRLEHLGWKFLPYFIFLFLLFFTSIIKRLFGVNSQISYKAKIGSRLRLPHKAFGVVISAHSEVGNDVTIYHLVTLGINEKKTDDDKKIIISDGCYISVGAKVISCRLGVNVKVAPNVVVYYDRKDGEIVKFN